MNKIDFYERAKVYADALKTYGITGQLLKTLEELTEVQVEIHRILEGRPDVHHLAEEVADASLMLEQIRLFFGINDEVCEVMDAKLTRLRQLIAARDRLRPDLDALYDDKIESGLFEED